VCALPTLTVHESDADFLMSLLRIYLAINAGRCCKPCMPVDATSLLSLQLLCKLARLSGCDLSLHWCAPLCALPESL